MHEQRALAVTQLQSAAVRISRTLADYEGVAVDERHVLRWARQFPALVRIDLLAEVDFVLRRTYFGRERVRRFCERLSSEGVPAGDRSKASIDTYHFLDLYDDGHSQSELLRLLGRSGRDHRQRQRFLYIDDFLLSGTRASDDIAAWLRTDAPPDAEVVLVFLGVHTHGLLRGLSRIADAASAVGCRPKLAWCAAVVIEDRSTMSHLWSDVVRPVDIPLRGLGVDSMVALRGPASRSSVGLFSSDRRRALLESAMVDAGLRIIDRLGGVRSHVRPLGLHGLPTFGFGTMLASYRTCPNHAPLALWLGDPQSSQSPWYPLMPRTGVRQREDLWELDPASFAYPAALDEARLPDIMTI